MAHCPAEHTLSKPFSEAGLFPSLWSLLCHSSLWCGYKSIYSHRLVCGGNGGYVFALPDSDCYILLGSHLLCSISHTKPSCCWWPVRLSQTEGMVPVSPGFLTCPCLMPWLPGEGGAHLSGREDKQQHKYGKSWRKHLRTRSLARWARERGKKTVTEVRPLALSSVVLQRLNQGLGEKARWRINSSKTGK